MHDLDAIVALLHKHHQRATYGAVAGLLGGIAISVMKDRAKDQLNSWVVSQSTGMPTGYEPHMIRQAIRKRSDILSSPSALAAWLDAPR